MPEVDARKREETPGETVRREAEPVRTLARPEPPKGPRTPQVRTSASGSPRSSGVRGRIRRAFASQIGVVTQAEHDNRARPNEMEFSGERSESAATTG